MDEKLLRKRLNRVLIFAIVISFIMVVIGFSFINITSNTLEASTQESMEAETDEYIKRLNKQIHSDYQLLNTLASMISDSKIDEASNFETILENANEKIDFLSMIYFDLNRQGIIVTLDQEVLTDVSLDSLNEQIQTTVEASFAGKEDISNLFVGDFTKEKVFLYSVPILEEGKVTGVLAATDHVEIFADVLSGEGLLNGTGRINLIDSKGNFLVRSNNPINKEDVDSIFDSSYEGNEEHIKEYRKALKNNEKLYFSFAYQSKPYRMHLAPVGINGWYLCMVNSVQASNSLVYSIVEILAVILVIVVGLVGFILIYGYRLIRKNNKELYDLAYYDQLTGAFNFIYFQKKAQAALKEDPNGCIATINVSQFKFINEIFGREKADQFLVYMAKMMGQALKKKEFFCRESADFFYLYLKDTDYKILNQRLKDILESITNFPGASSQSYRVLLSCGAVVSDENRTVFSYDQMMTHVMFALAKAREKHQNTVWFFDAKLHEIEVLNSTIEGNMHQALENKEFKVYLQPKIDLKTHRLAGAEALVRWVRPDGSILPPAAFISLFEDNGFCAKLDLYMFEAVCQCLTFWKEQGIKEIPISVNQSKVAVYGEHYIETIQGLLEKYQVPSSLITIEILESMAMSDTADFNKILDALHKIGFKVSMDDFGSGYSSLNVLGKIDIDEMKIDKDFLKEVSEKKDSKSVMIMEEMIQLSKKLNLKTVVEGVETKENEEMIRQFGCDYAQGYYYSKPIPVDEFVQKYLRKPEEIL